MGTLLHVTAPRVRKGVRTGGEWLPQGHADSGLIVVDEPSAEELSVQAPCDESAAVEDTAPEFEWARIESLMGDDFHLDPNRTASIPVMKIDDDIAQMTRKVMNYVAKTQSVEGMSDAEIAAMVGLTVDGYGPEMPDRLRKSFDVPGDERIVVAVGKDGHVTYLSTRGVFKRTGSFRSRMTGETYTIENIAPQIVAERYRTKFSEQHPEFDPKDVDNLFRRMADKSVSGKGYKYLWDESVLPSEGVRLLGMSMVAAEIEKNPGLDANEFTRLVARMDVNEIRTRLEQCETGTVQAYDSVNGFREVPAYKAQLGGMRVACGKDSIDAHLAGETVHAKKATMNRAYRQFLEDELAIEYDYQRSRAYVRDANASHSATVFEEKKNVPQSHVDAAEKGYFKTSGDFTHVEVDEDADLDRLSQVEREYAQLRRFLPKTPKVPTLRFRKTGRHKALGVYHPGPDNIAVDPRHPSSFLHEFIHHVDHTAGERNISSGDEFRPLLRAAQRNLAQSESRAVHQKLDYYQTPTEVLSRTAEVYFYWKTPGTSLNGDATKYADDGAYRALEPLKDQIIAFWDSTLPGLGAEIPGAGPGAS